jgi:hypothetical protein
LKRGTWLEVLKEVLEVLSLKLEVLNSKSYLEGCLEVFKLQGEVLEILNA